MPAWLAPAITAGMGLIGGATQENKDKRQIRQQEKLYDVAEQSNKHMAMFNHDLQMQMWRDTGPVGQMEQLKKAGLNPGLIYGMGGAGGQTAAAAQAQGVSSAQAPSGSGREMEEMAGMGIAMASQVALMDAQKRNIEADTANKQAQTKDTLGETNPAKAKMENLIAQTANEQAKNAILKINQETEALNLKIKSETINEAIDSATANFRKSEHELEMLVTNKAIQEETKHEIVELKRQELANMIATKSLIESNISKNEAEIEKMAADITQRAQEIAIKQGELTERQRNNLYYNMINDIKDSTKLTVETAQKVVGDVIDAFTKFKAPNIKNKETHTYKEEGYEHKIETYK